MSDILVLKPRLSEQTYALSQSQHVYVFDVPKSANKHAVARAVAVQFKVKVASVNMASVQGKVKSTISITGKRRRNANGMRSDIKKAYVRLVKGDSLPVFAAIEESAGKEQAAQEQADKAMAKQLQKEAKKPAKTDKASGRSMRLFKKQGDK